MSSMTRANSVGILVCDAMSRRIAATVSFAFIGAQGDSDSVSKTSASDSAGSVGAIDLRIADRFLLMAVRTFRSLI